MLYPEDLSGYAIDNEMLADFLLKCKQEEIKKVKKIDEIIFKKGMELILVDVQQRCWHHLVFTGNKKLDEIKTKIYTVGCIHENGFIYVGEFLKEIDNLLRGENKVATLHWHSQATTNLYYIILFTLILKVP